MVLVKRFASCMPLIACIVLLGGCSTHESTLKMENVSSEEQYVKGTVTKSTDSLQTDSLKDSFEIVPAYPNPFSPTTTVDFHVPREDSVTISFYDVHGVFIGRAFQGYLLPGTYRFKLTEAHVNSGVYLIKCQVGDKQFTRKTIIMR